LIRVYRILRKPWSKKPLDGEGAWRFGGRWSSPGTRLVYTAEHLSLAMIEYFVHVDPNDPPKDLVVVAADVPDSVSRIHVVAKKLPSDWRQTPAPPQVVGIGDSFGLERKAAVMIVPSALAPSESNWLINPGHPEFHKIRVLVPEAFQYDARFFGGLAG
jgi:RES domain-containing protein